MELLQPQSTSSTTTLSYPCLLTLSPLLELPAWSSFAQVNLYFWCVWVVCCYRVGPLSTGNVTSGGICAIPSVCSRIEAHSLRNPESLSGKHKPWGQCDLGLLLGGTWTVFHTVLWNTQTLWSQAESPQMWIPRTPVVLWNIILEQYWGCYKGKVWQQSACECVHVSAHMFKV